MGGIKNKLSKLSNEVNNLLNSLPLVGRADEMTKPSQSREGNNNKTIPLSDYRLTSPFSQRGTKLSLPLAKGRQMSVAHRWGRIAKCTSLACLSLAIVSTLILNIISSYSNSHIESNAEPVTQANGPLVSGPATISLSITPLITPTSSPCDTSNSNICMKIPDDGGIATGGHTIKINTNSIAGWSMSLSASNDGNLVNNENEANVIRSLPSTADIQHATTLSNNTWGIALPYGTNAQHYSPEANYLTSDKDTLASTLYSSVAYFSQSPDYLIAQRSDSTIPATETRNIYYGVRVDNPSQLLAGDYQTQVVYTATVKLPSKPTITSVSPNTYELGSGESEQATIKGANLESTYKVYIESNTDSTKQYDITSTITNLTDTGLTVTIPTDQTNPDLEPGDYTIHVVTQGGEETIGFSYTKPSSQSIYDEKANVRVDFDKGMIPVKYNDSTEKWEVVTDRELDSNLDNWFDYDTKKWANAVTVIKDSQDTYYKARSGSNEHYEVSNEDILGYWVYIPRYAYKVLRRDMTDRWVEAQNFEIKFETNEDVTKNPKKCANSNSNQYYDNCVSTTYPGNDGSLANQTAWATHPAFTWEYTQAANGVDKTVELNGLWVAKFEVTGTPSAPTALPNRAHIGILSRYSDGATDGVGTYYDIAKSLGQGDKYNVGGNGWSTTPNSHSLESYSSHLTKNDEWGAVGYLLSSDYGVGINKIMNNDSRNEYNNSNGGRVSVRTSGCGPYSATDANTTYYDGPAEADGSDQACSTSNTERRYNGALGVLSSSTGNVYGVYDIAGGAFEIVAANMSSSSIVSTTKPADIAGFSAQARAPYVNLYTGFGINVVENYNVCTWEKCGGQGIHEVLRMNYPLVGGQSKPTSWDISTKNGSYTSAGYFPAYAEGGSQFYEWWYRGAMNGNNPNGVFDLGSEDADNAVANGGFRVVLMPTPDF